MLRARTIVLTAVPLVVGGAVIASAYVQVQGDGQGSTHTDAAQALTINVDQPEHLGIGESGDVTFGVTNPNKATVRVHQAVLTVHAPSNCPDGSFVLDDGHATPASTVTYTIPPATTGIPVPTGTTPNVGKVTLKFVDLPNAEQTACTNGNAVVTAHVS